YRQPGMKRPFRAPVNIGRFPVLALFGLLSSVFMFFYFEKEIIALEVALVLAGLVAYSILRKAHVSARPANAAPQ
ncbi:MAG: amino acid transporter, partial [Candidatus Aenigmarchaeota archaeon]|nr:amino acid transporter [Candidatus Aenigmarchaeota archaeon]